MTRAEEDFIQTCLDYYRDGGEAADFYARAYPLLAEIENERLIAKCRSIELRPETLWDSGRKLQGSAEVG